MLVQMVNIHRAVKPSFTDQPLQCRLRQTFNVHRFLTGEVDKLPQAASLTIGIVAEQRLGAVVLMDTGRLTAAGTLIGNCLLHAEAASVQVFLHMGNNHVPLGNHDPIPWHQLQSLNEGEIM